MMPTELAVLIGAFPALWLTAMLVWIARRPDDAGAAA